MAAAGVSYRVGREAAAEYDEQYAGVQPPMESAPIDPFVEPGNPASGLLDWVENDHGKPVGAADGYTQAYNYRYYTTDDPQHRIELTPPADYDAAQFELVGRYVEHLTKTIGDPQQLHDRLRRIFPGWMNSGEWNYHRDSLFTMAPVGISQFYAGGDYAAKARVWKQHQDYLRGLHRFMSTDPRVPEKFRQQTAALGLDGRPHPETQGWPHQLYIRVARRLAGRYTITAHDVYNRTTVDDPDRLGTIRDRHVPGPADLVRARWPGLRGTRRQNVHRRFARPDQCALSRPVPGDHAGSRPVYQSAGSGLFLRHASRLRLGAHGARVHDLRPVGRHRRLPSVGREHDRPADRSGGFRSALEQPGKCWSGPRNCRNWRPPQAAARPTPSKNSAARATPMATDGFPSRVGSGQARLGLVVPDHRQEPGRFHRSAGIRRLSRVQESQSGLADARPPQRIPAGRRARSQPESAPAGISGRGKNPDAAPPGRTRASPQRRRGPPRSRRGRRRSRKRRAKTKAPRPARGRFAGAGGSDDQVSSIMPATPASTAAVNRRQTGS
jgi:hypothetical protein